MVVIGEWNQRWTIGQEKPMDKQPVLINTERETRIFFWFMTLVLVTMSGLAAINTPELLRLPRLVLFTVLMSAHIGLHWMLRLNSQRPGWLPVYMLVQGVLAAALVYLSIDIGLAFAVSMALVGEAVGVYGVTRRGLLISAYYLVLSLGFYTWLAGFSRAGWWLLGALPIILFVVLYVEMYTRQSNANERASVLLEELESANRQLSAYAAEVEDLTIAAERERMARELHDTLSQGLAGLILQLEAADAHLAGGRPEKARQIVQNTMESARATLADARRAIDNLRTGDDPGIEAVLQREAERFAAACGLPCEVSVDLPVALPAEWSAGLQRMAAEGLSNIARHAGATQASLTLRAQSGVLVFEMRDNGHGFDPAGVPEGHYGLIGMRERARLLGGTLEVQSRPGQGALLRFEGPLP